VLAVLGMHRSGTSLTAEMTRRFGAATGQELVPADKHNPRGYGEDVNVIRIHDALLAALDRPWNTVRGTFPLPDSWTEGAEFETARANLAVYLASEFSRVGTNLWAVKDPRMSILLPLWFRLAHDLDFEFLPVLCIRSPEAVAASIEKRDSVPADLGRLIWLQYNAAIVREAGSRIKAVLDYDDWFIDPNRNLDLLTRIIDITVDREEAAKVVSEIVSSASRHHAAGAPVGLFQEWWSLLQRWARDQTLPAALTHEANAVRTFLVAFEPWRRAVTEQGYLMAMIDSRETERRELVAAADRNLKAYRTIESEMADVIATANRNLEAYRQIDANAKAADAKAKAEIGDLVATADRNLEAYRQVDSQLALAKEALARVERERDETLQCYNDLSRRHQAVMRRFGRFPFSLIMPADALG